MTISFTLTLPQSKLFFVENLSQKAVLHITSYFAPDIGGVEQVASDIVDSLDQSCRHTILCFGKKAREDIIREDGVRIVRVKRNLHIASQPISFKYKKTLKRILKEINPDIIHFHFPSPFAARYVIKCRTTQRLFVHWHSDIIKQKIIKKFFNGQTKKLLEAAEKIIVTSPNYINNSDFLPLYKNKCVVIPNIPKRFAVTEKNKQQAKSLRADSGDKIRCLFVGRHVQYKGIKYLIEAAGHLGPNIMIYIAGIGPLTGKLQKNAPSNVRFLGKLSENDLINHMLACDIFTFPSITKNEAFGLALAEAMSFGLPSVTFTIPGSGVNYVSLDGVTGIQCENSNACAFAAAINKLASSPVLRKTYGDNAKQRIEQSFSSEEFKKNILGLYSA